MGSILRLSFCGRGLIQTRPPDGWSVAAGKTAGSGALDFNQSLRHEDHVLQDTDTLYIQFRSSEIAETRELDENTLLDIDRHGHLCGLTLEHARERADIPT
jgi:uncharacterized protein YuzE